ncbi:MAG: ATP-binding protein [Candidatus Omnitrophica bacterium]|nr:ATP-binding protein [Candidatus Omnitrophota bacterium]
MKLPIFKRDTIKIITDRLLENRKFIQVINGPRQVGKTTAIQQVLEDLGKEYTYAASDLPAPPAIEWISEQWELARIKLEGTNEVILVLDEVQKISNWAVEVKRLWDEDSRFGKNIKVVILGSSALLLQKGLSESLAGRFEIIQMSHWGWEECKNCFNWSFDEYIYFGGYPGAASLIHDEKRWAAYIRDSLIETAISKDILLLNRVEKPALLRQLFVLACEYGGQILSYQKLLGQLSDAGNTTTLAHYQKLFEAAFLMCGLPKWTGSVVHRRKSSPKWMPLNTALMTALGNLDFQSWRKRPDLWGRLIEVAVGAHLINEGSQYAAEIYYWREGNYEVDFVIKKGNKLVGIEVKSGNQRPVLDGLKKFAKKYPSAKTIVVGNTGVEIEEFLKIPLLKWIN